MVRCRCQCGPGTGRPCSCACSFAPVRDAPGRWGGAQLTARLIATSLVLVAKREERLGGRLLLLRLAAARAAPAAPAAPAPAVPATAAGPAAVPPTPAASAGPTAKAGSSAAAFTGPAHRPWGRSRSLGGTVRRGGSRSGLDSHFNTTGIRVPDRGDWADQPTAGFTRDPASMEASGWSMPRSHRSGRSRSRSPAPSPDGPTVAEAAGLPRRAPFLGARPSE